MDDLILRQDAIDAMNEVYCHIEMIKKRPVNKTEQAMYLDMIGAVKTVPSISVKSPRWFGFENVDDNDYYSMAERRTE